MSKLVVRNCSFVPELTEGTELRRGDLLFQNGVIERIAPCGTDFGEAEETDAHGMTALPGLIDAHIHLTMTHDLTAESCFVDPVYRTYEAMEYAQYLLNIGITTVRDCGEDKYYSVTALRNAVNAGIVTGPRILTCGITLCPTEAGSTPVSEFGYMLDTNVDGPEDVRRKVRQNLAHGVDFIKLYGSGSMMANGSKPGLGIMEDDEIREAVAIARQHETYCAVHCHGEDAIDQVVSCGCDTVEHASFISDRTLDRLAGAENRGIIPTLSVTVDIIEHTDPDTLYGQRIIHKVKALLDDIIRCLRHAYDRGDVLIGWGTDQPFSAYRREPGSEFRIRKEYLGYDNLSLLKQATINSAKLCRIDDRIGTIKEGKLADVILVEGDPVKDISVMYRPADAVFRNGVPVK